MKYIYLVIVVLGIFLSSCTNGTSKKQSSLPETKAVLPVSEEKKEAVAFILESFSELPLEIDGCACYFSLSKSEFEKGNFIYVDNMDKLGFVKIKDSVILLPWKKGNNANNRIYKALSNKKVNVQLQALQMSQLDETQQYEGAIEVRTEKGTTSHGIYGECGC